MLYKQNVRVVAYLCCALTGMTTGALAQADCGDTFRRWMTYEPNYSIMQSTSDDEPSIESHYSIRYTFTDPANPTSFKPGVFFAYTGDFDFYAFDWRPSSPVINRLNNPALHVRWEPKHDILQWLDIGVEHRSNGQVVAVDDTLNGMYRTEIEYEAGNLAYFDALSRSANYFSFAAAWILGESFGHETSRPDSNSTWIVDFRFSAKLYLSESSAVNWGPWAGQDLGFADYDRGRLYLAPHFRLPWSRLPELAMSATWVFGDLGMATDSIDLDLKLPINLPRCFQIPLYLRYHNGPMSSLANYTLPQESFGVGIVFQ